MHSFSVTTGLTTCARSKVLCQGLDGTVKRPDEHHDKRSLKGSEQKKMR